MTIARERAAQRIGRQASLDDVVLIGDTPRDVAAGLTAGVRVIAVASGRSTVEDLRKAGANDVLPDLTDTAKVTQLING
ncbi:HAD hydrolase-like protein [Lentzea sp. NPDC054927]